jgi:hypothetical protein
VKVEPASEDAEANHDSEAAEMERKKSVRFGHRELGEILRDMPRSCAIGMRQ